MKRKQTKFSPDPWSVLWMSKRAMILDANAEMLATLDERPIAEYEANAALLKAAPKMYAMLEKLHGILSRGISVVTAMRVKAGWPLDLAKKRVEGNIGYAREIKNLLKKARGEK